MQKLWTQWTVITGLWSPNAMRVSQTAMNRLNDSNDSADDLLSDADKQWMRMTMKINLYCLRHKLYVKAMNRCIWSLGLFCLAINKARKTPLFFIIITTNTLHQIEVILYRWCSAHGLSMSNAAKWRSLSINFLLSVAEKRMLCIEDVCGGFAEWAVDANDAKKR